MPNPRPLSTEESIEILKRMIKRYEDDLSNDPLNRRLQTNMNQLKMRLTFLEKEAQNQNDEEDKTEE